MLDDTDEAKRQAEEMAEEARQQALIDAREAEGQLAELFSPCF